MLKSGLRWLAALVVIAITFVTLAHGQPNAGYTVTLQEVLTTPAGTSSIVSVEVQAQRQDGATVLQLGPEGETARHIRIPPGVLIETNDRDKRMSTFHVTSDRVIAYVREPQQNCRRDGDEFRGEEMVGGYRAAKIVSTSGGSMRWYALEHYCAMVRSVMEHRDGSKSEKVLVSLVPGAPPEALFQTDGYVEGPPSALGVACEPWCREWLQRMPIITGYVRRAAVTDQKFGTTFSSMCLAACRIRGFAVLATLLFPPALLHAQARSAWSHLRPR